MGKQHLLYLHLGSNQGDRRLQLQKAIAAIEQEIGLLTSQSSIYETAAWGITDQADFLNQAVAIDTELSAEEVLSAILRIEQQMGREKIEKWGPRLIDIDILFYDDLCIELPKLTIPHPHLQERGFVLIPMLEIAADFYHPIFQKTIEELYIECKDPLDVRLIEYDDQ